MKSQGVIILALSASTSKQLIGVLPNQALSKGSAGFSLSGFSLKIISFGSKKLIKT